MIIWWIEDYLSGAAIEEKFYSTKEEALNRRNELGYGFVREWDTDNPEVNPPSIRN